MRVARGSVNKNSKQVRLIKRIETTTRRVPFEAMNIISPRRRILMHAFILEENLYGDCTRLAQTAKLIDQELVFFCCSLSLRNAL